MFAEVFNSSRVASRLSGGGFGSGFVGFARVKALIAGMLVFVHRYTIRILCAR